MAWTSRGRDLPPGWPAIRAAVLARDGHRCTAIRADGTRCPETTRLEVDHIGDRHDHRPANLRTLCHWHHAYRTAAQSHAARRANTQAPAHPGMMP
jgi:5-methylcytosine-specific restriction endonuclease McrA